VEWSMPPFGIGGLIEFIITKKGLGYMV